MKELTAAFLRDRSRLVLLLVGLLFIGTRLAVIRSFPIFNDEALYVHYAQLIHDDWAKFHFVSMNGLFGDWKPPLQFWLAAPVIQFGNDPLLAARLVAFACSVVGLFGIYAFTHELFGNMEAALAALLWAICPTVLFHNVQFTAETFLISTAPLFYWMILKTGAPTPGRWLWSLMAVLPATALLLFKQSGFLLLAAAMALPLARFRQNAPGGWRKLALHCGIVVAVILFAQLLARLALPAAFDETRDRFNAQWVMTSAELMRFPLDVWRENLQRVGDYISSYYGWSVPPFVALFLWHTARRRSLPDLALAAICLAGAAAVCFLLRGFNEYIFNTAVIVALVPLLARFGILIWELFRVGASRWAHAGILLLAGVTGGFWLWQIGLMNFSAGRYVERSTPWAIKNYLRSWSTGFGIADVLAMLEREKQPGLIFADAQWGNPNNALLVYGSKRFPNLHVVPISREFLDPAETRRLRDDARQMAPVRFAIFSADRSGERASWQTNVEREMCLERREVRGHPTQTPIIVCRF